MGGTSLLGMLLGPEDTGTRHRPLVWGWVWCGCLWWPLSAGPFPCGDGSGLVGGLLENCTVDASIFDLLWSSF